MKIPIFRVRKMNKTLLILFLSVQHCVFGHEYFFAYSEVEYNSVTQRFQATIVASAHDIEETWGVSSGTLEALDIDPQNTIFQTIEHHIRSHFRLNSNEQQVTWALIGCEAYLNDIVHFYLESEPTDPPQKMVFRFDLLMDEYPEQQNKLTFYYNGNTQTGVFLQEQREYQLVL